MNQSSDSVKKNVIANIIGRVLSAVLSIVFVPYYLKYLGVEAYGLVGLYATLQSVFMLADMGLSGTFMRETAKLSVERCNARILRDLCRTFEGIFLAIGLGIACFIALCSRIVAERWVNVNTISSDSVVLAIVFIGIVIGLQFPFYIYQGGVQGLQKQTSLNIVLVGMALLRGLCAVFILAFIDASIQAFFIWQAVVSVLQLMVGHVLLWKNLPAAQERPRFDLGLLRPLMRFAAGTAGITLTGLVLTQADKIILIKMLPLDKFGYYTLSGVVAGGLGMIAMPFNNAIYPRLTQLVAENKKTELIDLYHRACQMMAVPLISMGLVMTFFSKEIILAWTGNMVTAQNTFMLISFLAVGNVLMGLMLIPYALQLAFGWTKLGLIFNAFSVLILIPALIWLVLKYGAIGACLCWVALYLIQITGMIHCMHRRFLQGEKLKWYVDDVIKPLMAPLLIVGGSRFVYTSVGEMLRPQIVVGLAVLSTACVCASAMSTPLVRKMILDRVKAEI